MNKIKFMMLALMMCLTSFTFAQVNGNSRYISEDTKKIVFVRDGGSCKCCGSSKELEYDHITPYSCGGTSEINNIQLLCQECNRSKSNSCVCKIHYKTVGNNCCEDKNNNNTIKSSSSDQCSGITKKGSKDDSVYRK